ncbi:MAG: nitroreductase family protein [Desulfovibrionaceae bacterium]
MDFKELVTRTRSYRRFKQGEPVAMETLKALVDLARQTASAANKQPLKYILSTSPATNAAIFPALGWAAYMPHWAGPAEGERPTGYVIICLDTSVADTPHCDQGIVSQTIMLGATEKGLGGCIMGSVNRDKLRAALDIPQGLDILLVLALGVPGETVVMDPVGEDGGIKYWRDDGGVHHVPKRALDEIIVAGYE